MFYGPGGAEASVNQNGGEAFMLMPPISAQVQLINDAYNLLIDAMLGPEADCSNIKEPYSGILVTLKQVNIPIISVDVPSGKCSHWLGAERDLRVRVEEEAQARATELHPVLTPHVVLSCLPQVGTPKSRARAASTQMFLSRSRLLRSAP